MKKVVILWLVATLVAGCSGGRRPLPTQAELMRQDSLERLAHRPKPRTFSTPEEELLSELPYRTLPMTYEEGFERTLPGFGEVPPTQVPWLLGVEGLTKTKAIRLPDRGRTHVFLVGGEDADEQPAVYMVTLDSLKWTPVDQLTLYEQSTADDDDEEADADGFVAEEDLGLMRVEFSVTSRYEIYIQVVFQSFVDERRELEGVSVFSIGSDGKFFELEKNRLNYGAEED